MNDSDIARKCRDTMWSNDVASQDMGMTVDVDQQGAARAQFEVRKNMVNTGATAFRSPRVTAASATAAETNCSAR